MSINLLTLNCWGLKYIAKHREQRLSAIADHLALGEHDIVALQEVWVEKDWLEIDLRCKNVYPYRRNFRAGVIAGPGLCILLKFPIESTFLYRFPVNGRPSAFFRGDWYVGKSIAVTIIDTNLPGASKLAVLNSHMHSPYALTGDAAYLTHRTCQAWDMAKYISMLRLAGYAVIQVGDLNSQPDSLPYRIFTQEGGVVDSWDVLHRENHLSNEEIALMNPHDQIKRGGVTCDSQLNTWRANRQLDEAKRLDYALVDTHKLTPLRAEVKMTDILPAPLSCSYSDHFGYSLEFAFASCSDEIVTPYASTELYEEIIENIDTYLKHTIPFQSTWRFWHFAISMVLVILIQVAIAFASSAASWSSVLLSVGSTIIAITGVVNGLIWLISTPSEKNNLEEVRLEVLDAQRANLHKKRFMDVKL